MQTSEHPDRDAPATTEGGGDLAVDRLLQRSAQGDRAAFAAFYDATVPWVHGLATAMFASPEDAQEATARTYLTAWEEAPEAELDVSDRDGAVDRERRVFAWLSVLAHRVMTGMRRTEGGSGSQVAVSPAVSGADAPVPADLAADVAPEALRAVRLAWLGGLTAPQVARTLGLPTDRTRTLLRDGVRQIDAAFRREHGLPPAPPTDRPDLGEDVAGDLKAGRGAELADLTALHALDSAGHGASVGAAQGRGAAELAVWRSRVDGARRAVTWVFRDVVAEPPSTLLDVVLGGLPSEDLGEDLVERDDAEDVREPAARPRRTGLLVLLAALVLALGAWTLWSQFTSSGIQSRVDRADDLYTTTEHPAQGGGTAQAFLSRDQNIGYLAVSGMPQLPAGQAYQVWLHPEDGSAPASLGTFDAGDFSEPVTFRGLDRFAAVSVTAEPDDGSDIPTGEPLLGIDLRSTAASGPQYGGRSGAG